MRNEKNKIIFFMSISIIIIIGILIFILYNSQKKNEKFAKYVKVEAILVDLKEKEYTSSDDSVTYYTTYSYEVNGQNYKITPNYSTNNIKKIKIIKYNPANPNEVIFPDENIFLVIGLMVVFIAIIAIAGNIAKRVSGFMHMIMDFFIAIMFLILGIFTYIIMCLDMLEFNLSAAYNIAGFSLLIPFFEVLIGVILTIAVLYATIKKQYDNDV